MLHGHHLHTMLPSLDPSLQMGGIKSIVIVDRRRPLYSDSKYKCFVAYVFHSVVEGRDPQYFKRKWYIKVDNNSLENFIAANWSPEV